MSDILIPMGGAGRLPIQACSRMPAPERGFGFQEGVYHNVTPLQLATTCVNKVTGRIPGFDPSMVNGIILTCANPTGAQNFTGRTVANSLGWTAWGNLVNQLCMSGLRGIIDAANMMNGGFLYDSARPAAIVVVGVEKMSECRLNKIFERDYCSAGHEALGVESMAMGFSAEQTADRYDVSEDECNALALRENANVRKAILEGWFTDEIVPIDVDDKTVEQDALPDALTSETIAAKKKYFFRHPRKGGKLTQFTSSQMSDGAAAVVLCNEAALKEFSWTPMARFVGAGIGTVAPRYMGEGLIAAFEQFLKSQGYVEGDKLKVADWLDKYTKMELNTAFASIPLALMKKHGIPADIVNVAGGATTPIGHPLGATGVRLTVTLVHLLARFNENFGYAGACVGEGQGGGCGFENLAGSKE